MLNDNSILSPLAAVETKIQNRIVIFLALKDTIRKLGQSKSPIVSQQAAALWAKQRELETGLAAALGDIEKFKQGVWTFSDIGNLTTFYFQMETQIADVRALEKQDAGVAPTGTDWSTWLPWLLVGIPGYFVAKSLISRGRR